MNYAIIKPNTKGQIVIPKSMRDSLGITEDSHLHLTLDQHILKIEKIASSDILHTPKAESIYDILKSTQGAWAGDNWPEEEKKIRKMEIKEMKKMRAAW